MYYTTLHFIIIIMLNSLHRMALSSAGRHIWRCSSYTVRRLQCRSTAVYSGAHGFNDEEIRGKLQNFPGGSIDLIKQDSGIAVMTVNNPSRMNAFSGRPSLDYLSRHDR